MATIVLQDNQIEVSGDLTVETITKVFEKPLNFNESSYRMDLMNLGPCDSAGLAMLIHWYALAKKSSVDLEFRNVPEKLREIANLGGLGEIFEDRETQSTL